MNLGGPELIILIGIAVLLFGAGWLPKAAKNLGKAKVEFDEVQRQFNETKDSVVEATGVKELEATISKANKVINTSPQKLVKDAAKNAVTGSGAAAAAGAADQTPADQTPADPTPTDAEDGIEDAEIVDPDDDENITLDFT